MRLSPSLDVVEPNSENHLEWPLLRRIFGELSSHWKTAGLAFVCILAQALLGLVPAIAFKSLIDYFDDAGATFGRVAFLGGAAIAAGAAIGLLGLVQSYYAEVISQSITSRLRRQLYDRFIGQSVSFFAERRSGELLSRVGNDVNGIQNVIADTLFGSVKSLLVAVSTVVLMFSFDWRLTLLILVILPLLSVPMRRAGRATRQARTRTQTKHADMTAYLQEVLTVSGILVVKTFVKEVAERRRFADLVDNLRQLEIREAMIGRRFDMLVDVVKVAVPAVLLVAGGYLVLQGSATVGTVFVFATVLSNRLAESVGSLASMHVNVIGSLALFQRIFEYIDLAPQIRDQDDAIELRDVEGRVTLEDVTFRYAPHRRPAIDRVSLEIEPGRLVAIVGPSGAGKTTLTHLLARFYDPDEGRVLIDGHDIRGVTLESLGRTIGLVLQDTFLFHASIRSNILYSRPDASEDDLVAAARAAHLDDVIAALPDGFDTVVGDRGYRLSGGEKQRVAIARVVLKNPRILILDEAMSNLDTLSEQVIAEALEPLLRTRTSFVVAHRLSTVRAADVTVVLDRGRVVEVGSHPELLAREGLYRNLHDRQFAVTRQ